MTLIDPWMTKWAELLCGYSLQVEVGQTVAINATTPALPLVRALHLSLLRRGAFPVLRLSFPEQMADFLEQASDRQLDALPQVLTSEVEFLDASVRIWSEENANSLSGCDPKRQARWRSANWDVATRRMSKPWCATLFPTHGSAQAAGMSLDEFKVFVYQSMFLHRDDPAAAWRELAEVQDAIRPMFSSAKTLRLQADGTDLSMCVDGRIWVGGAGRINMPDGEMYTGPLEDSVNGCVRFSLPAFIGGHELSGVELIFKDGVVVHARAEIGESYLLSLLATDAGSKRLGEVGIGLNYAIQRGIKSVLFDEKIGGTVHLALGSSYPETNGVNQSALHLDLVVDLRCGGVLSLDGRAVQVDGQFV